TGNGRARTWRLQKRVSRAVADMVIAADKEDDLSYIAANPSLPADAVASLIGHPSARVRSQFARREDLTAEQLERLPHDVDVRGRTAVCVDPGLTEEQRGHIDIDASDFDALRFERRPPPPVDEAARLARSVNPLLRRRAALQLELPVSALAHDEDPGVRL